MPLIPDASRNVAAGMTVAAFLIAALYLGRDILIPLALAVLLSFILAPSVRWLARRRLPRPLAVLAVMTFFIGGLTVSAGLLGNQLLSLTASLDGYRYNLVQKVRLIAQAGEGDGLFNRAAESIEALSAELERELKRKPADTPGVSGVPVPPAANADKDQPDQTIIISDDKAQSISYSEYVGSGVRLLAQAGLTLLFMLFLLLQHNDLRDRLVRVAGTDNMTDTTAAMSDAGSRLSRLFLTQALLNAGFGVVVGLLLYAIGVPNALLWGITSMLMRFVPFVGSVLAAVPPLLLAAAVDPGWTMFSLTLLVFGIGEPLMGHVVEPLVLGKSAGLSPLAMLAAASFWTLVWGPVGLLLAAPLTLALMVSGRYIPSLAFANVLLGDQPALTPQETFYHRLLSRDAITAASQLEEQGAEQPLHVIGDRVVLPALRLAAIDNGRGNLDRETSAGFRDTVRTVSDLVLGDGSAAEEAATTRDSAATQIEVVTVPGYGPIDASAAQYVADVIRAGAGCPVATSTVPTFVSLMHGREDGTTPDAVVICTVGGLEPAQLAFIVRRAARLIPNTRIHVLDFGRDGAAVSGLKSELNTQAMVYGTLENLMQALGCAVPASRAGEMGAEPAADFATAPATSDHQHSPARASSHDEEPTAAADVRGLAV